MEDELNLVAMNIIIHAGDARNKANEAMNLAKKFEFNNAYKSMEDAEKLINKAHVSQTEVIQEFAGGKEFPANFLFIHAQDTLMTIKSELHMFIELINVLEKLSNLISEREV